MINRQILRYFKEKTPIINKPKESSEKDHHLKTPSINKPKDHHLKTPSIKKPKGSLEKEDHPQKTPSIKKGRGTSHQKVLRMPSNEEKIHLRKLIEIEALTPRLSPELKKNPPPHLRKRNSDSPNNQENKNIRMKKRRQLAIKHLAEKIDNLLTSPEASQQLIDMLGNIKSAPPASEDRRQIK